MSKVTTQLFGDLFIIPKPAQASAKETLTCLTDVMQAYTANEQRLQLRATPRQEFDYSTPLTPAAATAAFNTLYGNRVSQWAVPVWTEAQFVGDVAANVTGIACDTLLHDLRAASLALLVDRCGVWQLLEIDTVVDTSITLSVPTVAARAAYLVPVRLGHATKVVNTTDGYATTVKITYAIDDPLILSPAMPAQYLSDDVYYAPFLVDSSIDVTLATGAQRTDYNLGAVEYRTPWTYMQVGRPYATMVTTAQEVRDFRNFFARCAGKFRQFWMPTFTLDMRKAQAGTVTNSLLISDDDYLSCAGVRRHITIQTMDGVYHPFVINSATDQGGGITKLNLNGSLNADASKILGVSYMGLHRLDTDICTLTWIGNGVAQSSLNILELQP